MCPGGLSGGVRDARWTQIDAIARVNVPWSLVEWRLPCQVICRKGECRACTAVCGRSVIFLQTIVRADVPWRAVWRGSRCSMDTNRCHRARGCALESRRMAIALSDELQERYERVQREERVQSVQSVRSVQSVQSEDHVDHEDHVQPPLLPQSTRVQECRADYDLKANSKPI